MLSLKRGLSLILALALSCTFLLPIHAEDPLSASFAAFLINAENTDAPERDLRVDLYRPDKEGAFVLNDSVQFRCNVNRTAGETFFLIQPDAQRVWLEVDYLTDVDGNNIYEMLDDGERPAGDILTNSGQLVSRSEVDSPWESEFHVLDPEQTYLLSFDDLTARGQSALKARAARGEQDLGLPASKTPNLLYYVSLHYWSEEDQEEYTLGYYLHPHKTLLPQSDVAVGSWYYNAVEYALTNGFFSGTGEDTFSPAAPVTRAQLAQILWRLGGSTEAADPGFSDVKAGDWYYQAIAWCKESGIMGGSESSFAPNGALTREQLAVTLRNFVKHAGADVNNGTSLHSFTDNSDAASWARIGLEWAVGKNLLSGYEDGTLRPGGGISRAELAVVLRTFCQSFPKLVELP